MKKLIMLIILIFLLLPTAAFCAVTWGQVLGTKAEHDANISDTNTPHFMKEWRTSGSWSPTEGYYRWTVSTAKGEDDDGYYIVFPSTSSVSIYMSFVGRWGASWPSKHVGGPWKWAMFYKQGDGNPRPTVFWESGSGGSGMYGVLGPDVAAGGNGIDEFDEAYPSYNYPNHTYKERNGTAANQWYYYVVGLVGDRLYLWIYSQDGTLNGGAQGRSYYARSQSGSFSGYNWDRVRLLAYVEQTANGDSNSYFDVSHIMVTQTKPPIPAGFLFGAGPRPAAAPVPPTGLTIISTSN